MRFLKITVKQLIDNWYVGYRKAGVPPFYYLTANHVEHLGTPKKRAGEDEAEADEKCDEICEKVDQRKGMLQG